MTPPIYAGSPLRCEHGFKKCLACHERAQESKFVPFASMSSEQANVIVEKSIHVRPIFHVEPVVFGSEADAAARLGALHIQLGNEHAVLTAENVVEFMTAIQEAAKKLWAHGVQH